MYKQVKTPTNPCPESAWMDEATRPRIPRLADRPVVRVKPSSYQPTRAELEEPIKIDATPEELALAVLRPVRIVRDPAA